MSLLFPPAIGAALLLAGCGSAPVTQTQSDQVAVVAGAPVAGPPVAAAPPAHQLALATPPPASAALPSRQLSVPESALINTTEMWSEPIR